MLQMFGAFAEFERSIMLERQRAGIEGKGRREVQGQEADRDEPA